MARIRKFNSKLVVPAALAITIISAETSTQAQAGFISATPTATAYTVLYEGTGGHNLQIANVTINGNIGVGGSGVVMDNGPSTIGGRVDFSAANTSQFNNNNGMNVGPTSVNFNTAAVTTALSEVNSLSTSLGGEAGANISINGNMTINASAGTLDGNGNRVFNVTSYNENDGNVVTINGDAAGDSVVLNFASSLGNVNLKGDVTLSGLSDDQVLWNFPSSGKNINLNTNDSSYPSLAFMGDILAPNDVLSMNAANLDGRFWGGDSSDMQIVSHDVINGPTPVTPTPEPGSLALLAAGLVALGGIVRRRQRGTESAHELCCG